MQALRRLAQTLSESQRSASTLGRAAEAVKSQVSSAASTVADTAKAATKTIGIKGKQGKGYIQFLEVRSTPARPQVGGGGGGPSCGTVQLCTERSCRVRST